MNDTTQKPDAQQVAQPSAQPDEIINAMTPTERSLLLYLETRAVDHGGAVAGAHMNKEDFDIAKRWAKERFVRFSRVLSEFQENAAISKSAHVVEFSESSFACAALERKRRAIRSQREYVKPSLEHHKVANAL